MISAPHAVTQTREGAIKWAEPETGVLAVLLNKLTNCHVIYKTKNMNDDANYDEKCNYKDTLCDYLSRHKEIRLVIDLHELSPNRDVLLDLGTGKGNNLCGNEKIVNFILNIFDANKFDKVEIDKPFSASFEGTVSSTVSRTCKIPCLQLEINSKLLCDDYPECQFNEIFNALFEIVTKFNLKEKNYEGMVSRQ